ncbi:MAG: RidA family protein [Desulfurococcaceae archaeon]
MKALYTERAPKPIGPYSQGIVVGNFIFVSGQIPIDPATGALVGGDVREQTIRVLENVNAILNSAGASLKDVVKVTAYLVDPADFQAFNEVYTKFFEGGPYPARTTVFVKELPRGARVEIDVIAWKRQ